MGQKKPEALLDEYGRLTHLLQTTTAAYDAERDALMDRIDPAIRAALEQLDADRTAALAVIQNQMLGLAEALKRVVIPIGHSVKGTTYQAVYTPGKPLWNNDKLEGYAMGHPEILEARRYGEPSVSFRPVKPKGETA